MLQAAWLPVNQAWCVLFGDSPTSVDGRFLWPTLGDLDYTLRTVGLVRQGRRISIHTRGD